MMNSMRMELRINLWPSSSRRENCGLKLSVRTLAKLCLHLIEWLPAQCVELLLCFAGADVCSDVTGTAPVRWTIDTSFSVAIGSYQLFATDARGRCNRRRC